MQMPRYIIIWEDPDAPELPCKVTVPSPDWIQEQIANGLTEEQAMEKCLMCSVPKRVWGQTHNRRMFVITLKENTPQDRTFRNAWRLNNV